MSAIVSKDPRGQFCESVQQNFPLVKWRESVIESGGGRDSTGSLFSLFLHIRLFLSH